MKENEDIKKMTKAFQQFVVAYAIKHKMQQQFVITALAHTYVIYSVGVMPKDYEFPQMGEDDVWKQSLIAFVAESCEIMFEAERQHREKGTIQ